MNRLIRTTLMVVAVGALAAPPVSAQPSVVDLGTLGGSSSHAFSINDRGQAVGYSFTASDAAIHAVLWTN